jgi:hypothetical protein
MGIWSLGQALSASRKLRERDHIGIRLDEHPENRTPTSVGTATPSATHLLNRLQENQDCGVSSRWDFTGGGTEGRRRPLAQS